MRPAPALLVLASAADQAAANFVSRHSRQGVALVVPQDLSRRGWTLSPTKPDQATAWIDGECVRFGSVRGVLSRLAGVTAIDLPHIVAEDRAYVAAEMTAFLLALLAGAGTRVANQPTPQCLCGPAWTDAKWRHAAAACGLSFHPRRMQATFGTDAQDEAGTVPELVSVVGGRCVTQTCSSRAEVACRLARVAGADMLTVAFDGPGPDALLVRADPWVDLDDAVTEQAVLALFGIPALGQSSAGGNDPAQYDPALGT